ncbi:TPA: hypothetical protein SMQ86_006062 [Pseudomonas aeruginosa]|nr:hypothetical protein [Pseudomonas aeruginosa]
MSLSPRIQDAVTSADTERNLLHCVPELREVIHFDTLWEQARLTLLEHAHRTWTDLADHDPGITLQQACTYGVADLAYRHTHPLIDLLTPGWGQPVFPETFGPAHTLTVSPITTEDYRRGILDLCGAAGNLLFRNVQLIPEPEADYFRYRYLPASREFQFGPPDALAAPVDAVVSEQTLTVRGGYRLYVEPQRNVDRGEAEQLLQLYLRDQRNLGEQVRAIHWVPQREVNVVVEADLEDDCQDPARVMAEIYMRAEALLRPQAQRLSREAHLAVGGALETLYEGPRLDHGWITRLPAERDYVQPLTLDLRGLPRELLAIPGLLRIRRLQWDTGGWLQECPAEHYPMLWGPDPEGILAMTTGPVKLLKRGQRLLPSEEEIKAHIQPPRGIARQPEHGPSGEYLDGLGEPLDIPGLLPACYSLRDEGGELDETEQRQRQQLTDYLALFQLWLANGCAELAALPKLLAFDQPVDSIGLGYWQEPEKALSVIDQLLGYFGSQRAPRIFDDPEFFASQRAALADWAMLGYQRANVPVNTVTALNKRLAFRLGIGAELFKPAPDLSRLPVYVIEYRALLPEMPNEAFVDGKVSAVVLAGEDCLVLTMEGQAPELPRTGQLISLNVQGETTLRIPWAIVVLVEGNQITLDLRNNPQLLAKVQQLIDLVADLTCSYSKTWLRDMDYPLVYAEGDQSGTERLLYVGVSAHVFQPGDTLVCGSGEAFRLGRETEPGLRATVNTVDISRGVLSVTTEAAWPPADSLSYWYREQQTLSDRFSFRAGVVLDRDYWLDQNIIDNSIPEEVMGWVMQVVREEMPAHVQAEIHWLSHDVFYEFGIHYRAWQQAAADARLGETSYLLMRQLSLGQLPMMGRGIGTDHVITPAEMESGACVGWYLPGTSPNESEWAADRKDDVLAAQVIYLPRDE